MRIEIQSLTLTNFKGLKQVHIEFGMQTDISGRNASGKTSIMDGFLWLLFGKDSMDRKDFGVKTFDSNGVVIPMLEHEVIGKLAIYDGDDNELPRIVILKRTLREIWTKPRGQAEAIFKGNETIYNVDMVPCTMKEYNDKVDSICKESLFKLLTNPAYFPELNWSVQRQSLFSLIPAITNEEILSLVPEKAIKQGKFTELLKIITAGKTLEEYRKQVANDIRRIKDEIVLIPARVDEVLRGMPEAEDWAELERGITDAQAFIVRKEEEKNNKLASVEGETTKRADIQAKINSAKSKASTIKMGIEDEISAGMRKNQQRLNEANGNIQDYEALIQKNVNYLKGLRLDMEQLQAERVKLLDEWKFYSNEAMPEQVFGVCPTCGQELPEDFKEKTLEENKKAWNERKLANLETNKKKGQNTAGQIKQKEEQIAEAIAKGEKLQADLDAVKANAPKLDAVVSLEERIALHTEYSGLIAEVDKLQKQLAKLGDITAVDTSAIDKEISFARASLDIKKTALGKRDQILKAGVRKQELEAQQKKLAQEIAALEQMEFSIETFVRTKVSMLEERINAMFSLVKFKMFNLQINGELAETCECSINGVPYSDLNNAARINAGIDIINTMSSKYGIVAPIWIDNRESVNELIPTKAQLINLYVTLDESLIIK